MAKSSALVLTWWSEYDPCFTARVPLTCTPSWLKRDYTGAGTQVTNDQEKVISKSHGFGSVSRRHNLNKPIIAAVNGGAFGGGTEMILNCDIVIAEENAKFGLPEVKRGVIAAAGGTTILHCDRPFWSHICGRYPKATSRLRLPVCRRDAPAWPKCDGRGGPRSFPIVSLHTWTLPAFPNPTQRERSGSPWQSDRNRNCLGTEDLRKFPRCCTSNEARPNSWSAPGKCQ